MCTYRSRLPFPLFFPSTFSFSNRTSRTNCKRRRIGRSGIVENREKSRRWLRRRMRWRMRRRRSRNRSWKKKTVTSLSLKMTNVVDDIFDGVGERSDAGEGTGRNSIETCRPSLSERIITVCQCGFTS